MATAVPSSISSQNGHLPDYDQAVRQYLLSLKAGRMPDSRPECGSFWEKDVAELERLYQKADGNLPAFLRALAGYCKDKPALADLLRDAPEPTPARVEPVIGELGVPKLPASAYLEPWQSAGACSWLDDLYVPFSKEASPEGYDWFHPFCGMLLLSAVAARRVYIQFQLKKIYSNLMIVLFSATSEYAKSTTAEVALNVLREAGLAHRLLPKRLSPQKLLSEMAGAHVPTAYNEMDLERRKQLERKLAMAGQRMIFRDEFGKFVQSALKKQSSDAEYVSLFLEFDGCPRDYDTSTFSRGNEVIESPYLSLLGCMTPPDLKANSKSGGDFWTDGFWARFSFVAAPKAPGKDEALDLGILDISEKLIEPLQEWDGRLGTPHCELVELSGKDGEPSGKFRIDRESLPETLATMSKEAHDAYKRYRSALKKLFRSFKHDDFNGSYTRLPETALRMALLMASLENKNRIELKHWARAQELAELLRASLHEMYAQVNAPAEPTESKSLKIEDDISRTLERVGPLTVAKMRSSYLKKYSSEELLKALRQMLQARTIKQFETSHGMKFEFIPPQEREDGTDDPTDVEME